MMEGCRHRPPAGIAFGDGSGGGLQCEENRMNEKKSGPPVLYFVVGLLVAVVIGMAYYIYDQSTNKADLEIKIDVPGTD